MKISLTGFLPDNNSDDSLKYEEIIPRHKEADVMSLLGWLSLADECDGELLLTAGQAEKIFSLLEKSQPSGLDFFVGVTE
ncbi:hypothetical protein G7007_09415 [Pseudomonas entomophila]|uniref:pyocin S6 family toxin immunity protein n=1 Tax=Pseudomonas entomophila TaxID=312306 RepID=UPI0015E3B86F|nr:pyocin S6 family toxin immunity protein [Pseudomonas entomophila]MBA1193076.1 hypothetical protein [Pseudomonas entomophila]MDF2795428.1 S-type pyocin/colicin family protein [Pseudomonas orientalis]